MAETPGVCGACQHPELAAIDEALVAGRTYRAVAEQYDLSKDTIFRHRRSHLSPALREAHERREEARTESLVDRLERLWDRCEMILDDAEHDKRRFLTLLAVKELRGVAELLGKLMGQIKGEGVTINLNGIPEERIEAA